MKPFSLNFLIVSLILLLTYPLFYYTYKYLDPYIISHDLDLYRFLYKNFDLENTETPFNTRLISSFLVYIISKLNIAYSSDIVFQSDLVAPNIYFSACMVSYFFFIASAFVIFKMFCQYAKNYVYPTLMTCCYIMGFGTLLYSLNPFTDSCGYFLGVCAFYFHFKKSKWAWLFLLLSIIQREYILLIFGLISVFEYFREKEFRRYHIQTLAVCVLSFACYFIMRKVFFYTPKYDNQLNVSEFLVRVFNSNTNWLAFFRQTIFNQNILLIYILVICYKKIKNHSFNKMNLILILLLVFQVIFFSLAGNLGNNGGRYFYIVTPLILFYLFKEIEEFLPVITKKQIPPNG